MCKGNKRHPNHKNKTGEKKKTISLFASIYILLSIGIGLVRFGYINKGNDLILHILLIYKHLHLSLYSGTPNSLPHIFISQIYLFALNCYAKKRSKFHSPNIIE